MKNNYELDIRKIMEDLRAQLQPSSKKNKKALASKNKFLVDEFMGYDGEQYINNIYRLLLKREADEQGLRHYSLRLREGMPKLTILKKILFSAEGRRNKVTVKGVYRNFLFKHLAKIKCIFEWLRTVHALPNLVSDYENQMLRFTALKIQFQNMVEQVEIMKQELQSLKKQLTKEEIEMDSSQAVIKTSL